MAMHKLEAEISKATGIKFAAGSKRQDHLRKLQQYCGDDDKGLSNEKWDELSGEAQKWANAATRAFKAGEPIPDFPDPEEAPRRRSRDDDEDEEKEEKSAKSSKADKEDKDEKKTRSTRGKDKEEPAPRGRRSRDDEEEKEEKKPAKATPRGRAADKEKEEEKPQRASRKDDNKPIEGVKVKIKELLIEDPEITAQEILKKIGKISQMSIITIGNLRADFRHSLKVLKQVGKLKGVNI